MLHHFKKRRKSAACEIVLDFLHCRLNRSVCRLLPQGALKTWERAFHSWPATHLLPAFTPSAPSPQPSMQKSQKQNHSQRRSYWTQCQYQCRTAKHGCVFLSRTHFADCLCLLVFFFYKRTPPHAFRRRGWQANPGFTLHFYFLHLLIIPYSAPPRRYPSESWG